MSKNQISPLAPKNFPALPQIAGVLAATHSLGLYKSGRDDLLVVHFPNDAVVAGALTKSSTRSCDVNWCAEALKFGKAKALIVNAGNSNAFTGDAGIAKNEASVTKTRALTNCDAAEVFLSATGVIGVPLPPNIIADSLDEVWRKLAAPDFEQMARTISTTDTFFKGAGKSFELGGKTINIAGIAKGSGMIAPNMATMLVYIFTDAKISAGALQKMVSAHVETTFNAITVDSDTSTSDTLLVFATGEAGNNELGDDEVFSAALFDVMHDLALQVVRDGEGAQKLIKVQVSGAISAKSAKIIAMAIANSPLVKTAIAGADANWGRVAMAVGKSEEHIDQAQMSIRFCGQMVAQFGGAVAFDESQIDEKMQGDLIEIEVDVGVGTDSFTAWTCDLTHGYIDINADYRS
ncbi:MAG: glutamate N-acetyltransferase / amino-acid N-acetyltransferase [Hyphomonadaceae bacterium]|nr:MAG: glutamate N-acetyltransferase / amino-acid N-acetyltransferase [Hyphomonadaceae bacterium]KAF0186895.1 MAG: glutamate N-acetyltransferase / amino-acid N-acetyltransferase [Hyphomonadaceae bacterium]